MRLSKKLLTLLGGLSYDAYAAYVASLAPVLWYKFNETSGTTVINYGSLSSADGTWTPGIGSLGKTSALGANQAYLYDGADSKVTGPTSTSINNVNKFTYAILVNLNTAGEANLGQPFTDAGNRTLGIVSATSPFRLTMNVWCTTMAASVTTTAGIGIPALDWVFVFVTYDDTADRVPHIFFGNAGAVTESTYSSTTPATNTLANGSGALTIGNSGASSRTLDGYYDEFLFFNKVLTSAEMSEMTLKAVS